ncbi:hypothetical protein LJC23_04130 [Desulfovibrio sp. OttesenSCG-928-I05]|nr:hypothetical protein [Desulfovibrio sp. OttesenSCG-928-I05]
MRESKLLARPFRDFIPAGARALWDAERVPEADGIFIAQPCIQDILCRVGDLSVEHSGTICPDGIQIFSGTYLAAPVAAHALCTWHFHPDGAADMSPEDWVVFLGSSAVVTALLTRNAGRIFQKSDATREVSRHVRHCLRQNSAKPALAMRRVFSLARRLWDCDFERFSDAAIAARLHIRVIT